MSGWRPATELEAAEIDDARFEAEVLLRHATGLSRAQLYASLTDEIDPAAQQRFATALAERTTRKPLAYITGTREFYRLEFRVTPDVLIPRPESELLVDAALRSHASGADAQRAGRGCGRGIGRDRDCAGQASTRRGTGLHRHLAGTRWSSPATNAQRLLRRPRAAFVQGDLLTPLSGPFHCVVANLPYIPEQRLPELEPEVAEHEPRVALTPGTRGTELTLRLITQLPSRLHPNGIAVLENRSGTGGRHRRGRPPTAAQRRDSHPQRHLRTAPRRAHHHRMTTPHDQLPSPADAPVQGYCEPRFAAVREQFQRNFAERSETGAALAVTLGGELVIDLWGGWTDARHTKPWAEDTIVCCYSVGKAICAILSWRMAERGELEIDRRVAEYWPRVRAAGQGGDSVSLHFDAPGRTGRDPPTRCRAGRCSTGS